MRAAVYARVSVVQGDREVAGSVEQQLAACHKLAGELGHEVVEVHHEEISATRNVKRPGFDALLDSIAAGRVDHVVCWSIERVVRKMSDLQRYVEACSPRTVLTSTVVAGNIDLSTPTGIMVAEITTAVAGFEVRQMRGRIERGLRTRAEAGLPAGRIPFGFLDDRVTHDPVEATAIRAATDAVLAGESVRSITRAWNDAGLRTAGGGAWGTSQVRAVLTRPRNAGLRQHRGKVIGRGAWEPIVPVDRYQALCAMLRDPERKTSPGAQPRWLLSGIATCGLPGCGLPMVSWRMGYDRQGAVRVGYRCSVERPAKENHATAPARATDEYVTDMMLRGYLETGFQFVSPTVVTSSAVDTSDLDARRAETISLYEDGLLSADEYRASLTRLNMRAEQAATEVTAVAAPGVADTLESLRSEWLDLDIDQQRQIVRDTVDVTIRRTGSGLRVPIEQRIGFDWKFESFSTE